jgi:hypothetical protein
VDRATALKFLRDGLTLKDTILAGPLVLRDIAVKDMISSSVTIANCTLESLDAGFVSFQGPVNLTEITVLGDCTFDACFFLAGFSAIRCRFKNGIGLRWGGHNKNDSLFCLEDCEFDRFADFEDDLFEGPVRICGCVFREGTNIFGLKESPLRVTFDVEPVVELNTGRLDLDEPPRSG